MRIDHGLCPSLPGGSKIEKNRSEEGKAAKFGTSVFLEGSAEPTRGRAALDLGTQRGSS